jgi:aspartate--ammonia ligase
MRFVVQAESIEGKIMTFCKMYSCLCVCLFKNGYFCKQNNGTINIKRNSMGKLIKPQGYKALLDRKQTEQGIKLIKEFFQQNISTELRLRRVTAPLFVLKGLGINDDLNGVERAVSFPIKDMGDARAEIVHSLAKWKRLTLAEYDIAPGYGIYTDMNAIRADEELDNLHSLYVDQWDWEAVIEREDRTLSFLEQVVKHIYAAILRTEYLTCESYPQLKPFLPREIHFVHAQELLDRYPDLSPKEREDAICKEYGAVFVEGIGGKLSNGEKHDGRAPDYDDWSTVAANGYAGLNGDILIWYPVLGRSFELSSMGIRVDKEALVKQLKAEGKEDRETLYFHQQLLHDKLPLSIGGGIGQSRLCMVLLHKAHIGEIQASIWPEEMKKECETCGMPLI